MSDHKVFFEWAYVSILVIVVMCLYRGQRQNVINLWDMVTSTDKAGVSRTDPRKLFECGAFVVMTVAFSYLVLVDRLTEFYAAIYVGAFVAARSMRDREQRLNKVLDNANVNANGNGNAKLNIDGTTNTDGKGGNPLGSPGA